MSANEAATFHVHVAGCVLLQKAGWTALFFAVKEEKVEIAKKLLAAGADVDIKDKVYTSPVFSPRLQKGRGCWK